MNEVKIITSKNSGIIPNSNSDNLIIGNGLSIQLNDQVLSIINNEGKISSDLIIDEGNNHRFVTDELIESLEEIVGITEDFSEYIQLNLISFGNNSWLVTLMKTLLLNEEHIFNNLPEDSLDGSELVDGVKEFIRLLIQDTTDSGFLYKLIKSYLLSYDLNLIDTFQKAKDEFINIVNIFKYSVDCSYITIQIKSSSDLFYLDRLMSTREFLDLLLFVISRLSGNPIDMDLYNVQVIDGNV